MPLGWQRLNTRQKGPNENIVFIKPLQGPDKDTARDFLERVAAVCVPIMKANYLAVVSLEEYPPNPEFVGRNFNAGEIIQLVLKAPSTGRWLPFRYVQMVMMHELAHCKQMNHSRAFWKVRNQYAGELRDLWEKGYTGDGLWGRGQALYSGQYTEQSMPASDYLFEHLCGGTYRSSSSSKRKRNTKKEKPKVSYAERKQRRILKKFGTGGTALGNDDDTGVKLEDGKKPKGKPRVAGSARGRELRAAAALARFEQSKERPIKQEEESETDSDYDSDFDSRKTGPGAVDIDGNRITDSKGNDLVKVCEDEDTENDPDARNELRELGDIRSWAKPLNHAGSAQQLEPATPETSRTPLINEDDISTASEDEAQNSNVPSKPEASSDSKVLTVSDDSSIPGQSKRKGSHVTTDKSPKTVSRTEAIQTSADLHSEAPFKTPDDTEAVSAEQTCEICSLANDGFAITCAACSHVLDANKHPNSWQCQSLTCRGGIYVNSADTGLCGICGAKRMNT